MSTTEIGFEATTSTPCPLCSRELYCYLIQDLQGQILKVVCNWTDQPPAGWDRTTTAKDGRGVFTRAGYRRKRKHFPDFVQLRPQLKDDIPQWKDHLLDMSGDRVPLRREGQAWELAIEYLYPDSLGNPSGKVVRCQWTDRRRCYENNRKTKQIRPWHWVSDGGTNGGFWSDRGKGANPWHLYRENEAKDEILRGGYVFAVAGEQAVETYRELGLVATTCQGGEANYKEIVERLKDAFEIARDTKVRSVLVVHPDNDITGDSKFGEQLLKECEFNRIPAVVLNPFLLWAEMPPGGDVWNWVKESGQTPETFISTLETAIEEAIDRQEQHEIQRKQRERWRAPEAYRGELGYWKDTKEDGEWTGRYFHPHADFDFQIERELISEEGGGLVLQIKRADDRSQKRVYLKSSDYSTVQKFTDALKKSLGGGIVCNLSNYALQALIRVRLHEYRITRKGQAYRLIDRVGQQRDGHWIFKTCQFTADGELTSEEKSRWVWNPEITGDETYFKSPAIAAQGLEPLRSLVQTMQRAFGSNFAPALLTMGYAAAGLHYQEIQEKEGAFPILNLYGDPGSGKTTAAECALSICGQHKEGMMVEVSVSAAYERLKLAGGLLHCLDDPKRDESLDEFLKGFYNAKARVVRGKDNAGFNAQKPHSPLMVTSNHACGENSAATQSRLVRLFFPKVVDGEASAFRELPLLQAGASAGFSQLLKLGYPAQEVYALEQEIAAQIPNAHLRIAKSLALLLCYALKVAGLVGVPSRPIKEYVLAVVCSQVNDPDESGDSLRDFLEKLFSLQSESKVGEWNCRRVDKEHGQRVLAIYIPGVWKALDKEFKVSYNRKIIESLLVAKGFRPVRQNFHADEDQSRAWNRAKLTSDEKLLNSPERTQRWCYELTEEFLREYSEKSGGGSGSSRSSRSSEPENEAETPGNSSNFFDDLKDHQRSSKVIQNPSDDLFSALDDRDDLPRSSTPTPLPEPVSSPKNGLDDLDDPKIAQAKHAIPEIGDLVAISGTAIWLKSGSDKLPWKEVPKTLRDSAEIPVNALEGRIFVELTGESLVLGISRDGKRVKVRNQETGRNSTFPIQFVHVLKKAGEK